MKISDIKCYPVWIGYRNYLVVKVETDTDVFGLGESGLSGREKAVIGAINHFRQWLVGRDPMRIGALWQEMYRSQYFEGGRVLTAAISAIDIALHDIKAKAFGVPVYEILGGKQRDLIPGFATAPARTGPEALEQVQTLIQKGWKVIRLMPLQRQGEPDIFEPRESLQVTADWISRIREACNLELILGIDYHHRLSPAETLSFCQRIPPASIDFLEEPIRAEMPDAYRSLRTRVSVPLAIGEEFASKWQFAPYLEGGLTDFARLDLCNVGGFTEAMKIAGWAEAHYIDLMPHNPLGPICTAATIHFCAAVPNLAWLEIRDTSVESKNLDALDLFPQQPILERTSFPVPDRPGLGVGFNEELAKIQKFQYWEPPHLRRRDGSYTNW